MSDKINVTAILSKRIEVFPSEGDMTDEAIKRNVKAAIKEIVEAVIDRCAKEVNAQAEYSEHYGATVHIDKESILKVKEQIQY